MTIALLWAIACVVCFGMMFGTIGYCIRKAEHEKSARAQLEYQKTHEAEQTKRQLLDLQAQERMLNPGNPPDWRLPS